MSIGSGSGVGSGAGSINSRNTSDIRTDGAFKLHPEVGAPEQTAKTDIA